MSKKTRHSLFYCEMKSVCYCNRYYICVFWFLISWFLEKIEFFDDDALTASLLAMFYFVNLHDIYNHHDIRGSKWTKRKVNYDTERTNLENDIKEIFYKNNCHKLNITIDDLLGECDLPSQDAIIVRKKLKEFSGNMKRNLKGKKNLSA